jgi:hypothetical protein
VERPGIPLWILPLIFILTIWNPATLALHAASSVLSIGARSTLSLVFLAARPRLPLAMFVIPHNGVWYSYLKMSGRVRAAYGLESQSRND